MENLALTEFHTHANGQKVGRKKLWTERITVTLDKRTLQRIDAARGKDEARLDVIRAGIFAELDRRETKAGAGEADDVIRPAGPGTTQN